VNRRCKLFCSWRKSFKLNNSSISGRGFFNVEDWKESGAGVFQIQKIAQAGQDRGTNSEEAGPLERGVSFGRGASIEIY